jgi:hypothetical protein
MESLSDKLEARGFTYGNIYKYVAEYGGEKGIIAYGILSPLSGSTCELIDVYYLKHDVPFVNKSRRIKKSHEKGNITLKNNDVDRLNKLNKQEYICYSLIKKI